MGIGVPLASLWHLPAMLQLLIQLLLHCLPVSGDFLPVSPTLFDHYSTVWLLDHVLWRRFPWMNQVSCSLLTLPVCLNDSVINQPLTKCSPQCHLKPCSTTSSDTLDYIPNLQSYQSCTSFTNSSAFDPITFMAEGIAPSFSLIPLIGLRVQGQLSVDLSSSCQPIPNTRFQIYHVDVALMQSSQISNTANASLHSFMYHLRDITCSSAVTTDDFGFYSFQTTVPPSYGPPRHINFLVNVDGYEPLVTRMYFDHDSRLHQLMTSNEADDFPPPSSFANIERVASWESIPFVNTSETFTGYIDASFDIVLAPVRDPREVVNTSSIIDIQGVWFDHLGENVLIETSGSLFTAVEIPHTRTWGSVIGRIVGNTIFGVDFHHRILDSAFNGLPGPLEIQGLSSLSKGFIQRDSSTFIEWESDQSEFIWTKPLNQSGYRLKKLLLKTVESHSF